VSTNLAALYAFRTTPTDPDAEKHCADLIEALTSTPASRTCKGCPNVLRRRHDESWARYEAREFCSSGCSGRAKSLAAAEARRTQRIEDVEWIVGTDSPENVATRLGYKDLGSLLKTLRRWGRDDLADQLTEAEAAA